jgi:acetyltransferase-like isoleucine patch superfamily enzyme
MSGFYQRFLAKLAFVFPGGDSLRPALHRLRGVQVGRNVWISQYVYLDELYPEAITIGDNCTLGLRTSVFTHFHWGPRRVRNGFRPVVIEPNVFIGPHCVILPGVTIGEGSVVKAGTAVTRSIPAGVFWGDSGGGPIARVRVPLTRNHSYEEFMAGLQPVRRGGSQK